MMEPRRPAFATGSSRYSCSCREATTSALETVGFLAAQGSVDFVQEKRKDDSR